MRRIAWFGLSLLLSGCSTGLANLETEVGALRLRLEDSQRSAHALRARMDDVENRALLLQDELETLRLTGMRDQARFATPATLPVVRVAPERAAAELPPTPRATAPAAPATEPAARAPESAPAPSSERRSYTAGDLGDDIYTQKKRWLPGCPGAIEKVTLKH